MKLSCLPVSLFPDIIHGKMDIYEWADSARGMGLDAIDMSILFFHSRTRRELLNVRDALDRAGMELAMITTYPDFTDPNPHQRRRELAHACSDIAVAAELGASYVRITAGQKHAEGDVQRTLENVVECFSKCEEFSRTTDVKLLYENHARPGAWDREDFDFDTAIFLRLAEMTKNMQIRINFDTANTLGFGDDPIPVFKKVFHQIETIHVADIRAAGEMEYTEIGMGAAPIEEIFRLAKGGGFDGLISIEEASMNGLNGISRAVAMVRELWTRV